MILDQKYSKSQLYSDVHNARKLTSKTGMQKTVETTGDLIRNKIADEITKILRQSRQNS